MTVLGVLVVVALAQPADAPQRVWVASASPVRSVLGAAPTPSAAPSASETLIGAGTWCTLFGLLIGGSGVGLAVAFNHLDQPLGSTLTTSIALPLMVTGGVLLLVGLPALIVGLVRRHAEAEDRLHPKMRPESWISSLRVSPGGVSFAF